VPLSGIREDASRHWRGGILSDDPPENYQKGRGGKDGESEPFLNSGLVSVDKCDSLRGLLSPQNALNLVRTGKNIENEIASKIFNKERTMRRMEVSVAGPKIENSWMGLFTGSNTKGVGRPKEGSSKC